MAYAQLGQDDLDAMDAAADEAGRMNGAHELCALGSGLDGHAASNENRDGRGAGDAEVSTPSPIGAWAQLVTPAPEEWFTTSPPRRRWLLRDPRAGDAGVLTLGKVGQFVAEGGAGKTMALTQLALAVATGTRWLGTFDVAPEGVGRVLLALGEEDVEEARRRLFNAARAMMIKAPPAGSIVTLPLAGVSCPMIERDADGNPMDAPFLVWLRAQLGGSADWRLIVVDPLSRFAGLDAETDNACATRFVQALESLVPASGGAAVLSSHHTNKLSRGPTGKLQTSSARGSTALTDGPRMVWTLGYENVEHEDPDVAARLNEIVELAHTKANYSQKAEPLKLRRSPDHGGALVPLDAMDLAFVAEASASPRRRRRAGQEAERDQVRDARERKEAERRGARAAVREAATRRRNTDDDETARTIMAAHPEAKVKDLVALVKAACACGSDRAHAAIVRVRGSS
jgi:regulatory protein RepA